MLGAGARIDRADGRGEHPLPAPLARGAGVFDLQRSGQPHVAEAGSKVAQVQLLHAGDVRVQRQRQVFRQHGDATAPHLHAVCQGLLAAHTAYCRRACGWVVPRPHWVWRVCVRALPALRPARLGNSKAFPGFPRSPWLLCACATRHARLHRVRHLPRLLLPCVGFQACRLTLRCSRLATAGFASLRERLSSNVGRYAHRAHRCLVWSCFSLLASTPGPVANLPCAKQFARLKLPPSSNQGALAIRPFSPFERKASSMSTRVGATRRRLSYTLLCLTQYSSSPLSRH